MALLWVETMDKYSTSSSNDVFADNFNWSGNTVSPGTMVASAGRFGGNAYNCTSRQAGTGANTGANIRVPLSAAGMSGSTLIFALAIRYGSSEMSVDGVQGIIDVYTAAQGGSQHFSLAVLPCGGLMMFPSNWPTSAAFFAPNVLYHNVWHWLEVKVSLLDSGSFEVRVDGATVMSGSSDFRSGTGNTSTIDSIRLTGARTGGVGTDSVRYGTIIVADGSGSTFNDFFGDMRIETSVPNGDGATANWTSGNAGANYTNLDEAVGAYNKDTLNDYITSATDEQVNLCTHVDHVLSGANTIFLAALTALAKNDGAKNLALEVVSNSTTDDSSTVTLVNGTYKWCNKIWEQDPGGGPAAWTLSAINAAEWGVKEKA